MVRAMSQAIFEQMVVLDSVDMLPFSQSSEGVDYAVHSIMPEREKSTALGKVLNASHAVES